ncbi:hypothetical protein BH20ACT5_BH20ACT5_22840 [soil metagenome]
MRSPRMVTRASPRISSVWLWIDRGNAQRLLRALDDCGFGSLGLSEKDFAEPGVVVQLGYSPKRIHLLTSIDGVSFEECWETRMEIEVDGVLAPFIDRGHLLINKRASGRPQDLADAAALVETSTGAWPFAPMSGHRNRSSTTSRGASGDAGCDRYCG